MALQSSGAISISDIKTELGSTDNSLRALSNSAGFTTPDSMSEFYGYSLGVFQPTENFGILTYNGNGQTAKIKGSKFVGYTPYFDGKNYGTTSQPRIYSNNTTLRNFFATKRTCSVSFWFQAKTKSTSTNVYGLFSDYAGASFNIWCYLDTNGYFNVNTRYNNNDLLYTGSTNYKDGEWHHVVVTLDQGALSRKIYFDGSLINTGSIPSAGYSSSNTVFPSIGGLIFITGAGTYHPHYGSIDRVRIYSNVLSSTSVTALYNESSTSEVINPTSDSIYSSLLFLDPNPFDSTFSSSSIWTQAGTITWSSGLNFTPDLVWIKNRNSANAGLYFDSVRGVEKYLKSDGTSGGNPEATLTGAVSSFDSNGFTHTSIANGSVNRSGDNYVAWAWKAGNGTVSNTSGSITSTVSANQTAGFSIIKYQGNATSGATIGHGLSAAPELVIVKELNPPTVRGWGVYHKDLGNQYYISLENSATPVSNSAVWNNTSPSSSVITLGSASLTNDSGRNFIAYAFHSVDGYQKIGSYTGQGTSAAFSVYTGFEPAWVMIRRTDSANSWTILDTIRDNAFTTPSRVLWADLPDQEAEGGVTTSINIDCDGFSFTTSQYSSSINTNGGTYIYIAFARK